MTKGMAAMLVYTTKECNYNSIVIVHQHGGYDVTCTLFRIQAHRLVGLKHFLNGPILGGPGGAYDRRKHCVLKLFGPIMGGNFTSKKTQH